MTPRATRPMLGAAVCVLVAIAWAGPACGQPTGGGADRRGQERAAPQAPSKPAPAAAAGGVPRGAPGRPGSFELGAGAHWLAPGALGERTATLTPGSSAGRYTYFRTSARMAGAPAADARLTYNLTRRFALEGGVLVARPAVDFTIWDDAEGAEGFTATGERLWQYCFDGNLLVFLPGLSFAGGRARTFAAGGAGYLRQLHDGRYSVETGTVYNAGAGLKYYFAPRARGFVKGYGLRLDARAYYKRGGFSFDDRPTWTAALGAGAIVAF